MPEKGFKFYLDTEFIRNHQVVRYMCWFIYKKKGRGREFLGHIYHYMQPVEFAIFKSNDNLTYRTYQLCATEYEAFEACIKHRKKLKRIEKRNLVPVLVPYPSLKVDADVQTCNFDD